MIPQLVAIWRHSLYHEEVLAVERWLQKYKLLEEIVVHGYQTQPLLAEVCSQKCVSIPPGIAVFKSLWIFRLCGGCLNQETNFEYIILGGLNLYFIFFESK